MTVKLTIYGLRATMFGTITETRSGCQSAGRDQPAQFAARTFCARAVGGGIRISLASLLGRKIEETRQAPRDCAFGLRNNSRTTPIAIVVPPALNNRREGAPSCYCSSSVLVAVTANTILSNTVGGSHGRAAFKAKVRVVLKHFRSISM